MVSVHRCIVRAFRPRDSRRGPQVGQHFQRRRFIACPLVGIAVHRQRDCRMPGQGQDVGRQ